jgi:hypothetical protein
MTWLMDKAILSFVSAKVYRKDARFYSESNLEVVEDCLLILDNGKFP